MGRKIYPSERKGGLTWYHADGIMFLRKKMSCSESWIQNSIRQSSVNWLIDSVNPQENSFWIPWISVLSRLNFHSRIIAWRKLKLLRLLNQRWLKVRLFFIRENFLILPTPELTSQVCGLSSGTLLLLLLLSVLTDSCRVS